MNPTKPIILSILFILLIWLNWSFNLKPLFINKEINLADYYVRTNQCEKAIKKMETDVLSTQSIIDSYAKLKYIEVVENCNQKIPGLKKVLASNVISVLKEVKEIRPYYTRIWIFLGKYTNILIENKELLKINNTEELKKQADSYFEEASQLSPKREEIILGQIQGDIISQDYQKAKEKAQQCINLNPESTHCWWSKIISGLHLNEIKQVHKDIEEGVKNDFSIISEKYLSQFKAICEKTKNIECFKELTDIFYSLRIYEEYHSDSEYHFDLIYISAIGEKEEILKQVIRDILGRFPELESKLRNSFNSMAEINKKTVNQYIDNTEKLMKLRNDLMQLDLSEQEIKDILSSQYEYKINQEIKLIK